jgi:sulfur carrier protein ThiS
MQLNYDKKKATELREKIKTGLDLTFKKLLETKRQNNGEFIFSQNGKIVKVKARDIKD